MNPIHKKKNEELIYSNKAKKEIKRKFPKNWKIPSLLLSGSLIFICIILFLCYSNHYNLYFINVSIR